MIGHAFSNPTYVGRDDFADEGQPHNNLAYEAANYGAAPEYGVTNILADNYDHLSLGGEAEPDYGFVSEDSYGEGHGQAYPQQGYSTLEMFAEV